MTIRRPGSSVSVRRGVGCLVAAGLVLAACAWSVADPWDRTRIRNWLVGSVGATGDFDWNPATVPAHFRWERGELPVALITDIRRRLDGRSGDDMPAGLALAELLLSGPGRGAAIQSTTVNAYQTILARRAGYCADYTQVYLGGAHTLDLPAREWGMSFDNFNGNGHAFNEYWDRAHGKWVFVDVYNAFFVSDPASGEPLSALEFRDRLANGSAQGAVTVQRLDDRRFGFRSNQHALTYYRRGADQFFLWFGNDVFSYDDAPMVTSLSRVSRALEQIWGIASGAFPRMRIYPTATNGPAVAAMRLHGWGFVTGCLAALALAFVGMTTLWGAARSLQRSRAPVAATDGLAS